MYRSTRLIPSLLLVVIFLAASVDSQRHGKQQTSDDTRASQMSQQRYIVKLKGTRKDFSRRPAHVSAKLSQKLETKRGRIKLISEKMGIAAAMLGARAVADLKRDPEVEIVEPDVKRYPTQPRQNLTKSQVWRRLLSQTTPYGITMVQGDQLLYQPAHHRKVCIIDSGYDLGHPDLPSHSGCVTGTDAYDTNTNTVYPWSQDDSSHGTHVAGTIAALANGFGVKGVIPTGQLPLRIVRVFHGFGNQFIHSSNIINAIDECQANGAYVINLSLSGANPSAAEESAFNDLLNAGILAVAAAGNNGDSSYSYPASYSSVISVAAIDSTKQQAGFSQSNSQVNLAAPGVAVRSTAANGNYFVKDGTSMATPHVTGVAALVWSQMHDCSAIDVRLILQESAERLPGGTTPYGSRNNQFGRGLVQTSRAYEKGRSGVCARGIIVQCLNGMLLQRMDNGLRHIADPSTFTSLYGSATGKVLYGVDDIICNTIGQVAGIASGSRLIHCPDGSVYFQDSGNKRHVCNPRTMGIYKFDWGQIVNLNHAQCSAIPNGPALCHPDP